MEFLKPIPSEIVQFLAANCSAKSIYNHTSFTYNFENLSQFQIAIVVVFAMIG